MATNIGQRVSNLIGFDPTPGFNLSSQANGQANRYGVTATGTTNLFGRNPGMSSSSYVDSLNQRVAGTGDGGSGGSVLGASTTNQPSGALQAQDPAAQARAAAQAQYGDPSQYDSAIRAYQGQLNGLQGQSDIGFANNAGDYTRERGRLQGDETLANQQYGQSVQQNTKSYQNNRNKVLNSTRSNNNALQRLLGINGSGNSSASYEQAPYASALQGSLDMNDAQETYGTNAMNLDNSNRQTKKKFQDAYGDLDVQRQKADNGVRSRAAEARANLLDQIASAGVKRNYANGQTGAQAESFRNQYQPEIEDLLRQVTELGRNPAPIQGQQVQAAPLTLNDYVMGRSPVAANQGQPGGNDISANFLNMLAPKKRDANGQPVSF